MVSWKNNKKKIFTLIISVIILLAGCGSSQPNDAAIKKFESAGESENIDGVVAENNNFKLIWNNSEKRIFIEDKRNGTTYSTTRTDTEVKLDEFGLPMPTDPQMLSDILIKYVDPNTSALASANSNVGAADMGHLTFKKLDNGIKITYYFDSEEISVPVEYRLTEEGLSVSVDPKEIRENECKIYSVSLAPFACSYKNSDADSYLFVPSGSGALIYPQSISDNGLSYSQQVYGTDPLDEVWEKDSNEQAVKLPVYGAKNGDTAVCAIISSGEEAASIEATYGSNLLGHSAVYSTFKVRGSSTVRKMLYGARIVTNVQYTDEPIQTTCQVDYYFLKGEKANYSGMAEIFRDKALKNSGKASQDTEMNLVIYGGANVQKSFLGVPYKTVYPVTDLKQAYEVVNELTEETGVTSSVLLKGFGESGIDIGEIGGGYTVNNNLGSISDLNDLGSYCKEKGIDLYFDFDMVRQSAVGWFDSSDTAKSTDKQTVYQYIYDKALCSRIEETRYSLISRASLTKNIDKLISKTKKWNISGLAFDTLSNIAYSDNTDINFRNKGMIGSDVGSVFEKVRDSGKNVASVAANYYAAYNSDVIFESPTSSNQSDGFSVDIPFYQMVFKGNTKINSEPVNLASNRKEAILKAVESGIGITYGINYSHDISLIDSYNTVFTTGTYGKIKESIVDEVKELKGYYDSIEGAAVKEHTLITDDVRKTVFDNGTVAYVNYSDSDYTGDFGTVSAQGYLVVPPNG